MNLDLDQPIAALGSPPGGAQRGIIRISGIRVREIVANWFEPDDQDAWTTAKSAGSHSGRIRLDASTKPIECPVQALLWPNRRSYTGQPLIELHLHGAPCLLEAVLGEAYRHGARAARPGEFTLRAFLAGKLDLIQAEAVLGVIDAQSHSELQTALSQLAGGISGRLGELRRDLLELLADLEAGLDFVDEDIEFVSRDDVINRIQTALDFVLMVLEQSNSRMQSRTRLRVVLTGLPNAGKSTLFNHLTGANSALVSPEQGTTRDFLTASVDWSGLSFDLIDTAGWEKTATGVAASAQDLRLSQLQQSDLVVWCTAADLSYSDRMLDQSLFQEAQRQAPSAIRILTKTDLVANEQPEKPDSSPYSQTEMSTPLFPISVVDNVGLSDIQEHLAARLNSEQTGAGQWLGMTAARCRETTEAVAASLAKSLATAQNAKAGDELIALDLRDALDHLGVILGVIYTDDILDRVFSKFCIGK